VHGLRFLSEVLDKMKNINTSILVHEKLDKVQVKLLQPVPRKFPRWKTYPDDDGRARDDLAGVTLAVNLAQTSPLAELLGIGDFDKVDVVLVAKGLNKLQVLLLLARLGEDAEVSLAPRAR
jgi:hypothetical protein